MTREIKPRSRQLDELRPKLRGFVENYISVMRCYVSLFESMIKGELNYIEEKFLPNNENLDFYNEEFNGAINLSRKYLLKKEIEKLEGEYHGLEARVRQFVAKMGIKGIGLPPDITPARRLRIK